MFSICVELHTSFILIRVGEGKSWREKGGEPLGHPSFLYAVARGANYSTKTPDLHKGKYLVTLGQVAFSALKV